MSKLFDQLKAQRGVTEDFLYPCYEKLTDPAVFPEMAQAVERIKQAAKRREKVFIFGDYDVDGVTASTLMHDALVLAGVAPENLEIMLPDRFTDGYGMSPRLVTRASDWGANLVITVDCGSGSREIVEELNARGIDTIVTDHHECLGDLPPAVAVINPKRADFPAEYKYLRDLAGVGVAFKLAQALVKAGLIPTGQEKWLLDLVLIGTICDNMPLTHENRILGFYGVKVLGKTRRRGLRELMHRAGVKQLTADAIGFQIGPRLNAAGRLETADLSLKLMLSNSATEAAELAEQLELLNARRRTEQQTAVNEIEKRGIGDEPVIIEVGQWHEGILGIVAGRLTETYHRPAFVLAEVENDTLKGSGRSFGDFNLAEALDFARGTLIGGGGHAGAAGVRLDRKNLYAFREQINQFYRDQHLENQERFWQTEADLEVTDIGELNLAFMDELKLLEPFGPGNAKPIFRLKNAAITDAARMGANRDHLRLTLYDRAHHHLKLIAFAAPEKWLCLTPNDHIEPLIELETNEFRGVTSVEGRILSIDILP